MYDTNFCCIEFKQSNFVIVKFLVVMGKYIKVTLTAENNEREIHIPEQHIVYLEADERHSQTFVHCVHNEFKVKESISEIVSQTLEKK